MARIDANGSSGPRHSPWTLLLSSAMAVGIVAIAAGLVVSTVYDRRLAQLAHEAAALKQEAESQQSLLALLRDPATQVVTLSGLEPAPGATGKLLWRATAGGLLVTRGLPQPPEGQAYKLWANTGTGAPQPAGVFRVNAEGVGSLRVAPIQGAFETFEVTLEPSAGVAAPAGAVYLAGKL